MHRRSVLFGLTSLLAAPSIVRASSLMPIYPADPAWIANHQHHPVFGDLIVRLRNGKNLERFHGIIQPGQFFWRTGGRLIDICVFDKTRLDITPGYFSVINMGARVPAQLPFDTNGDFRDFNSYKLYAKDGVANGG